MSRVLVIAAHPDDEVLGTGGTMAWLVMKGNDVFTLILGEGVTSRDEKRDKNKREKEMQELRMQIDKSSKILDVKKSFVFDYPDNRFDTISLLDIVKTIEKVKREVIPDIVFTHHYGDLNIDHRITFRAAMTAFRPIKGESVREIYSFEIPSSTEWNSQSCNEVFLPNCFFPIKEEHLKAKIAAMKCYTGEITKYPHPRSPEAIETLAKYRGTNCGYEYAEVFQIVRVIKGI